ncbi:M20 family metallopeptidase [Paenibacillus antibioticophila]|nr:M20 family metallopeptidase [Paenibacillus antibioticophila]
MSSPGKGYDGRFVPDINGSRVAEILQQLVRIPSVNPAFPGGTGEAELGRYVEGFLGRLNLLAERQVVAEGRFNVLGTLPGHSRRKLLLEAHMDTVQTIGMTIPPFDGRIEGGKLYGRGACDTKASLAAMLAAIEALALADIRPEVTTELAAVVDEETTYTGVSALAERIKPNAADYVGAVVGEPTGLAVIAAHKGCCRFYVDVYGVACHSSNPAQGVNAINQMNKVLTFLSELHEQRYPQRAHPLTGPPTVCVTGIQGGIAPNTVPADCRITVDRRTVPGEEPLVVYEEMKRQLEELASSEGLTLTVSEPFVTDYAMETDRNEPIVRYLLAATGTYEPQASVQGAAYCSDASKLVRVAVPSVVFGPGHISEAHTQDEWIELSQVEQAACALRDLILSVKAI